MPKRATLENQCATVGWPLRRLVASKCAARRWRLGSVSNASPEQVVAAHIEAGGAQASWCEGGAVNLLIKAAALDVLAERNLFQDRQDAVRRYLQAHLCVHRRASGCGMGCHRANQAPSPPGECGIALFVGEQYGGRDMGLTPHTRNCQSLTYSAKLALSNLRS